MSAMNVSLAPRPDGAAALVRLEAQLTRTPARIVACSGGIDSLLLATVAHRAAPATTVVAHTVTPAVPRDGTDRVRTFAGAEGWTLEVVRSREFDDERYLSNPADRCYFCKSNLYDAIGELRAHDLPEGAATILSGANTDDLGEYRPGLDAAAERAVRHPYVEAGLGKRDIRAVARLLGLREAELAASPCLASRLYTGSRVTTSRLGAIEAGEALLRDRLGLDVVRCRVRDDEVLIEVPDGDRHLITSEHRRAVFATMIAIEPSLASVSLDRDAYRPGRAIVR
jgi:uncharacterized protein